MCDCLSVSDISRTTHGCNSVLATKMALTYGDYVVTEAGFGADLGAEKFYDIKCRKAGLDPKLAVIVVTSQSLKLHGGVAEANIKEPNAEGLKKGFENMGEGVIEKTPLKPALQSSASSVMLPAISTTGICCCRAASSIPEGTFPISVCLSARPSPVIIRSESRIISVK